MGDDARSTPIDLPPFMRLWLDAAAGAMEAWQAWSGPTASPEAVRQLRTSFLNAWSDWWENYLRSPMFLSSAMQSMTGTVQFRKQLREQLDRLQQEFRVAGRQDIDELALAVQRSTRRVLDQLDEMAARLDTFGDRLDALTTNGAVSENHASGGEDSRPATRARRKSNREDKTGQPAP